MQVLLRDPPMQTNPPLLAGLNLVPTGQGQTPVPGLFQAPEHEAELATQTMSSSSSGGCSSASLSSQIVTGYGSINWAQALIERLSWVRLYAGLNETVQRMAAKSLVKAALE